MDQLLKNKLNELNKAKDFECWYLVKQPTEFASLCYLTSFLKKFIDDKNGGNLSNFIDSSVSELLKEKPELEISQNYRALRVAAFFGLIYMKSGRYEESIISEAFNEITKRCNGEYEKIDLYSDIIERQLEKLYCSTDIDEESNGIRKDYRLYPIMLLYKVLLELGHSTGEYSINTTEYRYIVATTKRYEDFLNTLLLIKLLREDKDDTTSKFEEYRNKFDNRMIRAIRQLPALNFEKDKISIKDDCIDIVSKKIHEFEKNPNIYCDGGYKDFLCSTKSLFNNDMMNEKISEGIVEINLTPEWFAEEAKKYVDVDEKAKKLYEQFDKDFGYNALKSLKDNEILNKLFIHDKDKNNLCYALEFSQEYGHMFGSIKGGSAKKHGLYKGKDGKWHTNSTEVFESDEEALARGKLIRDSLLHGYELINERKNNLKTSEDYANLYNDLMEATNEYIRFAVYRKYYHMLFPNLFPAWYNKAWTRGVLNVLGIKYIDEYPNRAGEIQLFINKTGVSDIVFSKIIGPLVKDKCFNGEDDDDEDMEDVNMNNKINFNNYFSGQGINLVIYGTPGCGKSFELNKRIKNVYKISDENIIRTTFYHDYSNTDFIGQIIPYVDNEGNATYKQNPGPFTKVLCKAYNSKEDIALVIEELNRGDAASIFGDIFQLLDRFKDEGSESYHKIGVSEYAIENSFIQQYLKEKTEYLFNDIRIPSNLYIFATMNTSDQNVFTLDTAFKRRWNFEKMTNDYDNYDKKLYVPGIDKTWIAFVKTLNKTMLELNGQINEDKQFGLYFVDKALLRRREDVPDENKIKNFAYKVFEYLWDDVVRFDRDSLFNNKFKTLDDLIDEYIKLAKDNEGMKVFNTDNLKEVND